MALGDLINDVLATQLAFVYFQPAAGVEIIITSVLGDTSTYMGLSNGTENGATLMANTSGSGTNVKIGITNTNYLVLRSQGGGVYFPNYSGLQIK